MNSGRYVLGTTGVVVAAAAAIVSAQAAKTPVEGVTTFTQVDVTIACARATKPAAVAGLKAMGFTTIVNLRMASEYDEPTSPALNWARAYAAAHRQ